ncbi:XRE family transcriptional regulator [Rhizobium leguminosarum]|uniref:XRE family transcriptional regulator n=1 Tax=Rhizobium leguminosarum TaxID=384 RepID=UPI000FEC23FB|nr:XRE family transcriptional regulator [Rhizobium leguminosarum]RWX26620.1 XRE family transcriptional regulator [Rhizobium leguminosarum]
MSKLTEKLHEQSKATGVTQAMISRELGITQQAVNNLFNGRAASSGYWREIAKMLEIPEDEMRALMIDAGRDPEKNTKLPPAQHDVDSDPMPNAKMIENLPLTRPGKMIPVLGEVVGGDDGEYVFNGQVQDYVACPPSLVNVPNAYSVYVDGESMSPRYRPGEVVYVHPGRPPRRGDDVIVQIHGKDASLPPRGFIKEYVGWAGEKLVLHQYNPAGRIEFEKRAVVSVHPIVLSGKYI